MEGQSFLRNEHSMQVAANSTCSQFIRDLAVQMQVLACLRWLGDHQVLAFIPLQGTVSFEEIADLLGVPTAQLERVVRMTATAGFLEETEPGYVAHTPLSASFISDLVFSDAVVFLGGVASTAALEMPSVVQDQSHARPFTLACAEDVKLRRQWDAFQRCTWHAENTVVDLISQLKWRGLGEACVVDVFAQSTAVARKLVQNFPSLQVILQAPSPSSLCGGSSDDLSGRVTVQKRLPGTAQTVTNAAAYIYCPARPFTPTRDELLEELNAHRDVLKSNRPALLVLAMPLLPGPGTVQPEMETNIRLWDLVHYQLTHRGGMSLADLLANVEDARDDCGRLRVADQLWSAQSATIVLCLKYEESIG